MENLRFVLLPSHGRPRILSNGHHLHSAIEQMENGKGGRMVGHTQGIPLISKISTELLLVFSFLFKWQGEVGCEGERG